MCPRGMEKAGSNFTADHQIVPAPGENGLDLRRADCAWGVRFQLTICRGGVVLVGEVAAVYFLAEAKLSIFTPPSDTTFSRERKKTSNGQFIVLEHNGVSSTQTAPSSLQQHL
jgi:hypothetical protein